MGDLKESSPTWTSLPAPYNWGCFPPKGVSLKVSYHSPQLRQHYNVAVLRIFNFLTRRISPAIIRELGRLTCEQRKQQLEYWNVSRNLNKERYWIRAILPLQRRLRDDSEDVSLCIFMRVVLRSQLIASETTAVKSNKWCWRHEQHVGRVFAVIFRYINYSVSWHYGIRAVKNGGCLTRF